MSAFHRMDPTEESIHLAVVKWMDLVRTPDWFYYHVPNQGKRSPVTGAKFLAMGLRPGVPDLAIVYDSNAYFIELKREGGKVTPTQDEIHEQLKRSGARVAVCRSFDDVRETFAAWGIPTREVGRRAA